MPGSRMLSLALCTLVVACRGGEGRNTAAADTLRARAGAAAVLAPLALVRFASAAEAEYAAEAAKRAAREDVRRYAQVIATDHRAVVGILDSIARGQEADYEATPASRELATALGAAHAGRDSLAGPAFDLAFIRAEVESQRQLIDRLDQELIPGMGGAPQRAVLQDVRAMAGAHLTRARQLLAIALRDAPPVVARTATPPPSRPAATPRPAETTRRADTLPRPRPDTTRRDTLPRPDTIRRDTLPRPRPDTTRPPVRPDTVRPPVRPDTLARPSLRI
jgi:predicted outer membrane protein